MPNQTTNYKLTKPLASELYDIDVQNGNMDIIDETLKEIETEASRHFAVNLLDNSDFTHAVNQRGFTTKEENASGTTYVADRWLWWNVGTANYSISISDEGFAVTAKSGTTRFLQRIEPNKVKAGKTYTAYCMCSDGTMLKGGVNNTTFPWGSGEYSCLFDIPAGKTVIWAAAYEGEYTAENLPTYQPKGYAQELAECQRYYWEFPDDYAYYGYGDAYGSLNVDIILPVEMRVSPTVTYNLSSFVKGTDNVKDSVKRVDVTATTKKVRFGIVTLNADLKNQLLYAIINGIKLTADL